MILTIIALGIIGAIVFGLIIASFAPDVLGIQRRAPRHRAESRAKEATTR